ncbi:PDZ domain-containing protein, partial [Klebsiella pneumoniae]|uniref:PDZ domain-containing protein n=1 Tax=Klebsiella pneumoniae TaxID=573 RepID=UPI001C701A82
RLHGLPSAARTPQADVIDQIGLRLLGGPVTIVDVLPSSAAARAGLRAGDQIVRFAGQPADQAMDLIRQIRAMPEQNASIDILRNDQPMTCLFALMLTPIPKTRPARRSASLVRSSTRRWKRR